MIRLRQVLIAAAAALVALSLASTASSARARTQGCGDTTVAATAVTSTSATLHGHSGCATNVGGPHIINYRYGTTAAYGTTVTATTVIGAAGIDQPWTITGLAPGTLYHFAFEFNGHVSAIDLTFTTSPAAPAGSESSDLAITQTASPTSLTAGGDVTYTLVATNAAGATAIGVTVRDTLPAGLAYVSATTTKGSCTREVSCSIGTLARGESATITIVATANVAGSITNAAEVGGTNPDPNVAANNRASTTVQVNAAASATTTAATTTQSSANTSTPRARKITAAVQDGRAVGKVTSSSANCVTGTTVLLMAAGHAGASGPLTAGSYSIKLPFDLKAFVAQVAQNTTRIGTVCAGASSVRVTVTK